MSLLRKVYNDVVKLKRRVLSLETTTATSLTFSSSSLAAAGDNAGTTLVAGLSTHSSVAKGHLVYLDSAKEWKRASAGDSTAPSKSLIGIATSTAPHTDGTLTHGLYSLNTSHVSGSVGVFTNGAQIYMSPETSGSFTTTIPSGSGEIVRVVGHAVDASIIYFAPSPDYIEI
tara:strand:+ start:481 stop:996 length:516 start_codon:yes stop_codon:yes gene_type:complete